MNGDRVHNEWLETRIRMNLLHDEEMNIQANKLPITTFTQILNIVSQMPTFSLLTMATNPTEKDEDVFEEDTAPSPIVCQEVYGDPCGDSNIIEHETRHESPIQCRSPVLTKGCRSFQLGSHNHRPRSIRAEFMLGSYESGRSGVLTKR